MHDENLSGTSMMSLSSTTTHRGLTAWVYEYCLTGLSQDLQNVTLIAYRGYGFFHIISTHSSITVRSAVYAASSSKRGFRDGGYSWLLPHFPLLTTDKTDATEGDLAIWRYMVVKRQATIASKHLPQLHTWRSSGNNLHSFHRCWPLKRNADFELHLCFQNIAFALN